MSSLSSPPPGGDRNRAPMLAAIIWVEASIAVIIVSLRMFTRARVVRQLGWDDWIMLGTLILSLTASALDTSGMPYGIGRHQYYLTPANRAEALKFDWLAHAWAIASVTAGKISVAFMLLRVSNDTRHFWILHALNIVLLVVNIPLIVITYVQCSPAARLWDPTIEGTCWDPSVLGDFALCQGAINAATDLTFALFPILIIKKLNLPFKRKVMLSCIMCLGVFGAACASVKAFYLTQLNARSDFTFDASSLMIWYTTEMYVLIVAGSIATLRPLALLLFGNSSSLFGRSNERKGYRNQSHEMDSKRPTKNNTANQTSVFSTAPAPRNAHDKRTFDEADSARGILDLEPGDIRKTTEVMVDYDTSSGYAPKDVLRKDWGDDRESDKTIEESERV